MGTLQIILASVFFVALVLSYIGKKRYPEKFDKILPYNFVALGVIFCYRSQANDKPFTLWAGVCFLAYGIFLLARRAMVHKED